MSKQTPTAYHEAGHAVAFHRLFPDGRYGGTLSIVRREGLLGTHSAEALWDYSEDEGEAEAIYACAGYAAVLAAGYPAEVAEDGCESDFECAAHYCDRPLEEIKAQALALLRKPENKRAIERLVSELLKRETLDSDWVDALIGLADGEWTEEDYRMYLMLRRADG